MNKEEHLYKIFDNVNEWLKFGEAKNLGLITFNAAIVFGLTQISFDKDSIIKIVSFYIFTPFALLSFIMCVIALIPILSKIEKGEIVKGWIDKVCNWFEKETKFENILFYGYLKDIDEREFEEKFKAKTGLNDDFTQFEKELSTQILYNSRITWLKYQFFKIGTLFFLSGILFSILFLLILKFILK